MNWKPIKDVPLDGYVNRVLLYIPYGVEKWKVGYAFPPDESCNRKRVMFVVGLDFLQKYEEPTHFCELTTPIKTEV